jgi:hypothetical protein
MNWLARQLVRQIVPMQLPHRREGWLASVSSRFSGTDLHRGATFLCPNIPSGVSSIFLHEPASSDPEPDDQAEDYQEDDDGYGDCDCQGLGGNSATAATAAAIVACVSSCCPGAGVRGRGA